jgi:hypothetical protein
VVHVEAVETGLTRVVFGTGFAVGNSARITNVVFFVEVVSAIALVAFIFVLAVRTVAAAAEADSGVEVGALFAL